MNTEGEITHFKMRPELMKAIMWQEDGADWSQIHRVIKTVNYLNRLMFEPDDYLLGTRDKPPVDTVISAAPAQVAEPPKEEEKVEEEKAPSSSSSSEGSKEEEAPPETPEYTAMIDLLKAHCAAIMARDNEMRKRYQIRM